MDRCICMYINIYIYIYIGVLFQKCIYIYILQIYFLSRYLVFTLHGAFRSIEVLTFSEAQFINLFHYCTRFLLPF